MSLAIAISEECRGISRRYRLECVFLRFHLVDLLTEENPSYIFLNLTTAVSFVDRDLILLVQRPAEHLDQPGLSKFAHIDAANMDLIKQLRSLFFGPGTELNRLSSLNRS